MTTANKKIPSVPAWQLKQWASEAARLHVESGTPLSDAVISTLTGKNVGIAHIKRVCEEANNQAFNILFNKGGKNRSIVFDGGPADPAVVVRELKDGFAEADAQESAMKTASFGAASSFDGLMEKTASMNSAPTMAELRNLRGLLKKSSVAWNDAARSSEYKYRISLDKLASQVRTALSEGYTNTDISEALKIAMPNDFVASVVLSDVQKKVAGFRYEDAGYHFVKMANAEHPLFKVASYTYQTAYDLIKFSKAAQLATKQFSELIENWPE